MRLTGILIVALLVFSCNNQPEDNAVLLQVPFKSLTDSIRLAPGNADLYYRRAMLLSAQDQLELARQDMRKAYALAPNEPNAFGLARLLKDISNDSAVHFLQQAVKDMPNSLNLKLGLARGYQSLQKNDEALALLDEVLKNNPGQVDAMRMQSEIFESTNQEGSSIKALERAHNLVPTDAELAYNLAYAYAQAGDPRALALSDSLIASNFPELEKAYYSKATYLAKKGQPAEALKNYNTALAKNYNFTDAYYDKGLLLYDLKQYREAQNVFNLGLTISPANADFYYMLGMTHLKTGNKNEALLNFQRAYGLDKSNKEAKAKVDSLSH